MEIVFCVDYTSSITSYFNRIRAMTITICARILQIRHDVRIGLVKFRSTYDSWNTNVHGFTGNINVLQGWFDNDEPGGVCPDGYEAVGDALNDALNIGWSANNNDRIFNRKVVILITDGAPNGLFTTLIGADPWIISNMFIKQGITLLVVGAGEGIAPCEDFYCALAERTGGRYIPLVNFERVFLKVIKSVFIKVNTFREIFRRLSIKEIEKNSLFKYSAMKNRVDGMINECETMDDIRKVFFSHRSYNI